MTDTTPATALREYTATAARLPTLGNLIWYSVPEAVRVDHTALTSLLLSVALEDYTPPEVKDKNVFMRVASSHARKRVGTSDPAIYENYLVRNVKDEGDVCVKNIVVEQVNPAGTKLNLFPAVEIKFDDGTITRTLLKANWNGELDQAEAVGELIEQDYLAERNSVNAYGIRELIRKVILDNGATTVRPSGGVYFLTDAKQGVIDSLVELANGIALVDVHPVPLVDNSKQREMLQKAVEAETIDEIDKTLTALDGIDTLTARKYMGIVSQMNALKAKTKDYADLLDEQLDAAQFRMNVYEAKVKKLFEKVD